MTHLEAQSEIVGKKVTVSRGVHVLLSDTRVTGIKPPISERSNSFAIKYGNGNSHGGILPSDNIQIVGN